MSVGMKTLEIMRRPGNYAKLGELSSYLVEGILKLGRETGHDICGGFMGYSCSLIYILPKCRPGFLTMCL